ncbi:MAG TPA: DNA recombination protein RmuC [Candidatus Paceibacterota bacterium]|nr:DNA recombination protein RmuC [Candidatus Paceibacterota bacterium]
MDVIFFVVVLIFLAAIAWRLFQKEELSQRPQDQQSLLLLQNQINELSRSLEAKLGESARAITDSTNKAFAQASESAKIIKDITQELAKVGEGQRQVVSIADSLKNLQDILKNPKQRGVLGEYYLETVLKNVLPPNAYKIQYEFKDGSIVDAAVFTKDGIIPVDSKFSLENYNRILEASDKADRERFEAAFANDLKLRIDETSKYIKPEEGTLGFAFMFIPSEAVYYDLLINKVGAIKSNTVNLIEYASGKKKVMVVSPTTFLAYLQTVLQGLKALRIEESAKKIGERVHDLGKHLTSYEEYMQKVGKNLGTTVSAYNAAGKEFGKINKDVYRITGDELELEAPAVEKPEEAAADEKLF